MASVNKVIIIGNVGTDVEVRYTTSGQAVAELSVATSEKFKNRDGQYEDRTEWHRVVLWGKQAEVAGEFLSKGSPVYFEGRLETKKWTDREGVERYTTKIIVEKMQLLGRKGDNERQQQQPGGNQSPQSGGHGKPALPGGAGGEKQQATGLGEFNPDDDFPY